MRMKTTRDVDTMVSAILEGVKLTSAGAISGGPGNAGRWGSGRLAQYHVDSFCGATYTLYSYSTPMAWRNPDGTWTMPMAKYSATTSRHQGTIRTAVRRASQTQQDVHAEAMDILQRDRFTDAMATDRGMVAHRAIHALASEQLTPGELERREYAARLDSIERRLGVVKSIEMRAREFGQQADRGDNIAMESTPYDKAGQWHSRSHP